MFAKRLCDRARLLWRYESDVLLNCYNARADFPICHMMKGSLAVDPDLDEIP